MSVETTQHAWGVVWRTKGGVNDYLMGTAIYPRHETLEGFTAAMAFRTRKEAEAFVRKKYGYIAKRSDLRRPPHNWRVPKVVRIEIIVRA